MDNTENTTGRIDTAGELQPETDKRQKHNRLTPVDENEVSARLKDGFENEPDTDFSLPENQEWAERIIAEWKDKHSENAIDIPIVINGGDISTGRDMSDCSDPSRPGVVVGHYCRADAGDIEEAIECAKTDEDGWRRKSAGERAEVLSKVAMELRRYRADLIGAAMADGGKLITESDPEVSEAIDFLEYYPRSVTIYDNRENLECTGKGIVVVVSPWNFPIAIPCGGVSAALAAGNTAILKPASDCVLPAFKLCECFWRAGISKKTLQFAPCSGSMEGTQLVSHKDVDIVILTGGADTAVRMLREKPEMNLYVNRVTTGAIVLRQPFGGMGKSSFGPGVKAGGPNYTTLMMNFRETDLPDGSEDIRDPMLEQLRRRLLDMGNENSGVMMWEVEKIVASIRSYDRAGMSEFYMTHDHFKLRGQDNFWRYLPVENLFIRLQPDDSFFQIMARLCAARVLCCGTTVSYEDEKSIKHLDLIKDLTKDWGGNISFDKTTDVELSGLILEGGVDRIRYAAPERVPALIHASAAETGTYIAREPVLMDGRVELIRYVREQSISEDYHRYGNPG